MRIEVCFLAGARKLHLRLLHLFQFDAKLYFVLLWSSLGWSRHLNAPTGLDFPETLRNVTQRRQCVVFIARYFKDPKPDWFGFFLLLCLENLPVAETSNAK